MKSLKSVPYFLLAFSIFISTIIGAIQNISFVNYVKRSLFFVILIFVASTVISRTLEKRRPIESTKSNIELTVPAEQITLQYGKDQSGGAIDVEEDEDGDFAPMDFREYKDEDQE
ncbi:hypothetical protein SAMN02745975_00619 [Geosporobacter subterraneus DSM 17957]|uniref:Uncharacterized protein n=1 Tax=Geosporobacter subterraneus DSM 17957 TaxID=1121919 RepID=A0A1M6E268_9FIRM|nr:hypothetical protein [Geosporobacter subterraneus]SHI79587.1 hypothetical protein SAMN02745975_00619 [Geosporobacter subterraneus DSM 17957]